MNNSLVTLRIINEEVKMQRNEIREYERQTKLLVENLRRIMGNTHVEKEYPVLVDSAGMYR